MSESCLHPNYEFSAVTNNLVREDNEERVAVVLHLRICCRACRMPFNFVGKFCAAPDGARTIENHREGAWVNPDHTEMAVIIEPVIPEITSMGHAAGHA